MYVLRMALLRDMKSENMSAERFGGIPLWGLKGLFYFSRVLSPLNILIICSNGSLGGLLSVVTDENALFFSFLSQVYMPRKAKTPVGVAWDSSGTVQMALTKLSSKKLTSIAFFRH